MEVHAHRKQAQRNETRSLVMVEFLSAVVIWMAGENVTRPHVFASPSSQGFDALYIDWLN